MKWFKENHGQRLEEGDRQLAYVSRSDRGWFRAWLKEGDDWRLQPRVHRDVESAKQYAEQQLKAGV